eukprot:106458-Rhodomonas_salina.1
MRTTLQSAALGAYPPTRSLRDTRNVRPDELVWSLNPFELEVRAPKCLSCYAAATPCPVLALRSCYAMSSSTVLPTPITLRDVRCQHSVWCRLCLWRYGPAAWCAVRGGGGREEGQGRRDREVGTGKGRMEREREREEEEEGVERREKRSEEGRGAAAGGERVTRGAKQREGGALGSVSVVCERESEGSRG